MVWHQRIQQLIDTHHTRTGASAFLAASSLWFPIARRGASGTELSNFRLHCFSKTPKYALFAILASPTHAVCVCRWKFLVQPLALMTSPILTDAACASRYGRLPFINISPKNKQRCLQMGDMYVTRTGVCTLGWLIVDKRLDCCECVRVWDVVVSIERNYVLDFSDILTCCSHCVTLWHRYKDIALGPCLRYICCVCVCVSSTRYVINFAATDRRRCEIEVARPFRVGDKDNIAARSHALACITMYLSWIWRRALFVCAFCSAKPLLRSTLCVCAR